MQSGPSHCVRNDESVHEKRSDNPKKVFLSRVHRIGLESNVVQLCDRSPQVEVVAQRLTAFPILSP